MAIALGRSVNDSNFESALTSPAIFKKSGWPQFPIHFEKDKQIATLDIT
jgi:hypothetical protein